MTNPHLEELTERAKNLQAEITLLRGQAARYTAEGETAWSVRVSLQLIDRQARLEEITGFLQAS